MWHIISMPRRQDKIDFQSTIFSVYSRLEILTTPAYREEKNTMAVPKRKTSKSKTRSRRANHDRVNLVKFVACPHCGQYTKPHHVCPNCGYYKDREIISQEED
jgi:large subunit ribosomal protein L32